MLCLSGDLFTFNFSLTVMSNQCFAVQASAGLILSPGENSTLCLTEMWAPPFGVLSLLQCLPVSVALRMCLLSQWLKEVSSVWCVSPVAYHLPASLGRRMVSDNENKRNTLHGQVWNTEHCVGDTFHHTYMCFMYFSVPGSELKLDQRLRVLSGGRQLQISSAERTDTASYTCTASSEAGTTSKVYSLQVYGTYTPLDLRHLSNFK